MEKPIQIEDDEWYYFGRIIQKQDHPLLALYVSWDDVDSDIPTNTQEHHSFSDAKKYCKKKCEEQLNCC